MTMTINNTSVAYMRMWDASNDLNTIYTISTAAPTPDYPENIRVVKGTNQLVIQNKNICNNVSVPNTQTIRFDFNKKVLQKTFTLSYTTNEALNSNSLYLFYGTDVSERIILSNLTAEANSLVTKTITLTNEQYEIVQNATIYYLAVYKPGANFTLPTDAQIENGDTKTTYVAHKEQTFTVHLGDTELAGISTYNDKIALIGDSWKILRNVGKDTLNSTNQIWEKISTSISNKFRYKTEKFKNEIVKVATTSEIGKMLCNYYNPQKVTTGGSYSGIQGIAVDTDGNVFINDDNYFDDLEGWENWLDNNTCLFYYALTTPTEIPILDATLLEDLNAIYNTAKCYEGQTNIETIADSGNVKMIVDLNAFVTEKEV